MKRRLFVKEFIGSKRKICFFSLIVTFFLVIVGLVWIDLITNSTSSNEADVIICGELNELKYGFKLYEAIPETLEASKIMDENTVQVVPCVTRCIISVQSIYSLNEVMCTVKGYEEQFIRNQLVFAQGRAPKTGAKEVALGNYMAQMLHVSVGDVIGEGEYEIAGMGHVGIALTLEDNLENFESQGYTVVGIVDENLSEVNYSVIMPYSADDTSIIPNTLEFYFKEDAAIDSYRAFIDTCRNKEIDMGSVSERFVLKNNMKSQMAVSIGISALLSFVVIYLLVSYLSKGIGKKLGLLKSFGIKNSTVTKIFSGGLSILVGISYFFNVALVNVICYSRNKQLSKFLGFEVHKYIYNINVYLMQLGLGVMFVVIVWGFIFWRIKTTSPNACMIK